MNLQIPKPIEKNSDTLDVNSIFYTIQGEGPLSGAPATFIRLAHCNLQCQFCDTEYSNFETMPVEQCVEQALAVAKTKKLVVITGGEPFRQYQLSNLVKTCLAYFELVQIETSGSCWQPTFGDVKSSNLDRVLIICSPKTPRLHPSIEYFIDAYKYVVRFGYTDTDGLPNIEPQRNRLVPVAKPVLPSIPVYISPCDEQDEALNALNVQEAVDVCMNHGYLLSLQIHKILKLE